MIYFKTGGTEIEIMNFITFLTKIFKQKFFFLISNGRPNAIMATSEVGLKWIWFIVIIADDDNDGDDKYMRFWKIQAIYDWKDNWNKYCDWGLLWNDMDIGGGGGEIMGAKAAPGGVAVATIFVCG